MIIVKSMEQIELMRQAGRIAALAREEAGKWIKEGISTKEIDDKVRQCITSHGAKPSFLNYNGFPASACISVNEELIHGIPSREKILRNGDIVKVDVGAYFKGYHGDCAATFAVGEIDSETKRLIDTTKESFFEGMKAARDGNRIGDIGAAVQKYVEDRGFSVVRDFVGHGVGEKLHEDPSVPNYGREGRGPRLQAGMVIAIEPMVNAGTFRIRILDNDWTVVTLDGKMCAHYENTVAITDGDAIILTDPA